MYTPFNGSPPNSTYNASSITLPSNVDIPQFPDLLQAATAPYPFIIATGIFTLIILRFKIKAEETLFFQNLLAILSLVELAVWIFFGILLLLDEYVEAVILGVTLVLNYIVNFSYLVVSRHLLKSDNTFNEWKNSKAKNKKMYIALEIFGFLTQFKFSMLSSGQLNKIESLSAPIQISLGPIIFLLLGSIIQSMLAIASGILIILKGYNGDQLSITAIEVIVISGLMSWFTFIVVGQKYRLKRAKITKIASINTHEVNFLTFFKEKERE